MSLSATGQNREGKSPRETVGFFLVAKLLPLDSRHSAFAPCETSAANGSRAANSDAGDG